MNVAEWLKGSISDDTQTRDACTQQLKAAYQKNFSEYITLLTQAVVNPNEEPVVRSSAAIALKNAFSAGEESLKEEKLQKWSTIEPNLKAQLKDAILQTLDTDVGLQAALSISAIASIDLPQNQWPEMMPQLLKNVTEPNASEKIKVNSLATIGYICEQIDPKVLVTQADPILTAVINGARKQEPSLRVRKYAFQSLFNSLSFIRANFHRDAERNVIMQVVCEGTQEADVEVQLAAFECLNKIVDIYYQYMQVYMNQALFGITMQSMQSQEETVVLQAIEFWSSLCEREIKISEDEHDQLILGVPSTVQCMGFARQICKDIVPVLFWFLTKQEEDVDDDEWTPAMAASTCLSLFAQCVGTEIVGFALPLIEQHLRSADWHFREAAVMLFGCILEGPSDQLSKLVEQALPYLLLLTQDPMLQIRDTSFWTLGRICEFVILEIQPTLYQGILEALVRGLSEETHVTVSSCWALMLFAEAFGSSDPHTESNAISPYFETVVMALMQIAAKLELPKTMRTSAYEAVSSWILASANDTSSRLNLVAEEIFRRLDFALSNVSTFTEAVQEQFSNLISVLSSLIRRLGTQIAPVADTLMELLVRVLRLTSSPTSDGTHLLFPSLQEDALLCVGNVANVLDAQFERYSDTLVPFLVQALSHHEDHALCSVAVGVVADLARALEAVFLKYAQGFMELLGKHLGDPSLHVSVKLAILTCFGDIALSIGGDAFEPYLPPVMHVFLQVCTSTEYVPTMQEYMEQIRESTIEALVGIVQAFSVCKKVGVLSPWIQFILGLIYTSVHNQVNPDHHSRNAAGLLGDIAAGFGSDVKEAMVQPWVEQFLESLISTRVYTSTTRDTAIWARERIRAM